MLLGNEIMQSQNSSKKIFGYEHLTQSIDKPYIPRHKKTRLYLHTSGFLNL